MWGLRCLIFFSVIPPLGLYPVPVLVCLSSLHFIWLFIICRTHLFPTGFMMEWSWTYLFSSCSFQFFRLCCSVMTLCISFLELLPCLSLSCSEWFQSLPGFLPWFATFYPTLEVILASTYDQKYESGKTGGKEGLYFVEETAYCGSVS